MRNDLVLQCPESMYHLVMCVRVAHIRQPSSIAPDDLNNTKYRVKL